MIILHDEHMGQKESFVFTSSGSWHVKTPDAWKAEQLVRSADGGDDDDGGGGGEDAAAAAEAVEMSWY